MWIDHFRLLHPGMQRLLARDEIAMHPFVAAELALGSLRDRARTLLYLDLLPQAKVAQLAEVRNMIEAHGLYSKSIGLIDAHLIASCLLTPGTQLWTRDAALEKIGAASAPKQLPGSPPFVGKGVWELKTDDARTWYRVMYLSEIQGVIYVLHAFEKDSAKTGRRDIEIAKNRLKDVHQRLREGGRSQ